MDVTTIGLDLAKTVFQVHGVDDEGTVVIRRQLRRSRVLPFFRKLPPCLVGIEACATAHHWARQLIGLGHRVKLMPLHYVKAYVKRNKNDMADAAAICEAVTRPTMRFVAVKGPEQQSVLMVHRTRELLVRRRTMVVNAIRAHLAEFGVVARVGLPRLKELFAVIADGDDERLPAIARACREGLTRQFMSLHEEIAMAERRIHAWHRSNQASRRLETIPGIGPRAGRLDRLGAEAELDRRQAAHGSHIKAGRSLSAVVAGRRRHVGDPARTKDKLREEPVARRTRASKTDQGRGRGLGQQDFPDRLGGAGHWRTLPSAGAGRSLKWGKATVLAG